MIKMQAKQQFYPPTLSSIRSILYFTIFFNPRIILFKLNIRLSESVIMQDDLRECAGRSSEWRKCEGACGEGMRSEKWVSLRHSGKTSQSSVRSVRYVPYFTPISPRFDPLFSPQVLPSRISLRPAVCLVPEEQDGVAYMYVWWWNMGVGLEPETWQVECSSCRSMVQRHCNGSPSPYFWLGNELRTISARLGRGWERVCVCLVAGRVLLLVCLWCEQEWRLADSGLWNVYRFFGSWLCFFPPCAGLETL